MKLWKDSQEEVKRITPDRQIAKAILKMTEVRMKALELKDRKEFATLVVEDYCPVVPRILVAQQFGETVKVHAGLQRIQL